MTECNARISLQTDETTPQAQLDLLRVGESVRRFRALTLGLLQLARLSKLLSMLTTNGVLLFVGIDFSQKRCTIRRLQPTLVEFIGCARHTSFETLCDNALQRGGHGSQKIGVCLTIGADETHLGEEGFRLGCLAKEDLAAFIKDENLVK